MDCIGDRLGRVRIRSKAATTPEVTTSGVVSCLALPGDQVHRRWWISLIGLVAVCGGFWAFDSWRLRADWQQAQRDLARGKPGSALARLARLAGRWPDNGEVQYDLGVCELALGHADRAEAAWARVPARLAVCGAGRHDASPPSAQESSAFGCRAALAGRP